MLSPGLNRRALSPGALALTVVLLTAVTLPVATLRGAQSGPLPLAGAVYDPSGAVLPGIELTLIDAQEFKWQSTTDASGRFEFPPVQPGPYLLEASVPGFGRLRQQFTLKNARDWDRAITLAIGELTETIHVQSQRTTGSEVQPAPGPQRVRIGGNLRAPTKIKNVNPVFPPSMREAGREGVVPLEAIIGTDGSVLAVRVLNAQAHPDFAAAAIDAVRQWRFAATLLNGVPVEVKMTVSVTFSLAD